MKRSFLFLFLLLGIIALAVPSYAAPVYKVDKAHSTIGFTIMHMMISKTVGSFTDFEDDVAFNAEDLAGSKFDFKIKAASVNTMNEMRDGHLKGPEFFDVEKFPLIEFKSKKVEAKGEGGYLVTGDLTMKDVTKEVAIPIMVRGPVPNPMGGGTAIGLETHFSLNRQDYHVKYNKVLDNGGLAVSDMVDVNVDLEAYAK
jgi:polyisoprenoid-binding protein YceI